MLSAITDDLIKTGEQVKDVDQQKVNCLEAFVKCKPLVDWLKTELKGNTYVCGCILLYMPKGLCACILHMRVHYVSAEVSRNYVSACACQRHVNNNHQYVTVFLHVTERQKVKDLVDLAMISAAGQGDMEIAKVSCLHAAATGYAAFIFDLPQNADFKVFYKQCQEVWKNLEADPALPQKLVNF